MLEWTSGTGGVRDPHIVRGPDGFHILATDLRVWRPEGVDWDTYRHRGSRDIVVWDSPDLVTWSEPRAVTVAPEGAGMAWAPKSFWDDVAGEYVVCWSSGLATGGPRTGPSCILTARTRDFVSFGEPEIYLERPGGVIDMTVAVTPTAVHRVAKQDDTHAGSWKVFHEVGDAFDSPGFTTVAREIGQDFAEHVEGPLMFQAHGDGPWYLWVDRYGDDEVQGYRALTTTDPSSGDWRPASGFDLPAFTKHGGVLPLTRGEHTLLRERYGV